MTGGYVEAGWSKEEIKEALELLRQGQTVYLFKGEVWDHRMLRHAVEAELENMCEIRRSSAGQEGGG
jgi:hypothetical protein